MWHTVCFNFLGWRPGTPILNQSFELSWEYWTHYIGYNHIYKELELSLDSDETKTTFLIEGVSSETGQKGDVHYCLNICQTAALILMAYSGHAIS